MINQILADLLIRKIRSKFPQRNWKFSVLNFKNR